MSRALAALVCLTLAVAPLVLPASYAAASTPDEPPAEWIDPPELGARNAILLDADSGQVLAATAADERHPVASTIKTLTALTVASRTRPTDLVAVGDEVEGLPFDGASVGLSPGDVWTVEQLQAAIIARSGNDAASALAVHVAGDPEAFLELMREDAQALGLAGATIETVHGLGDLDRLSARDLAAIGRAALADEQLAPLLRAPVVELPGIGRIGARNELLTTYPGADGVKTGFTSGAGRTLIASATRDGRQLLAVVLGSEGLDGHFRDAAALLDHGFDRFHAVPVDDREPLVELRRPGRWIGLHAPSGSSVLVPSTPALAPRPHVIPPVEVDAADGTVVVMRWGEDELIHLPLRTGDAVGGAATVPGAWLADRAYASMRAVTAAGLWPEVDR